MKKIENYIIFTKNLILKKLFHFFRKVISRFYNFKKN